MVARGDLGVELGLHRVPFAQKFLIRKGNEVTPRLLLIEATEGTRWPVEGSRCTAYSLRRV